MKKLLLIVAFMLFVSTNIYAQEWYEGGTLHGSNALEWQTATFQNKLATCADIVSFAWEKKIFKPEIQSNITSLDSVMILSKELVKAIDIVFEKNPDPKKNKMLFTNQKVSSFAAMLMVSMGWVDL